jgi:hypothetical protein
MGRQMIDVTGKIFGNFTVLNQSGGWCWCLCTCGQKREVRTDKLKDGSRTSCGCVNAARNAALHEEAMQRKASRRPVKEPGLKEPVNITRMKTVWAAMMQRCYNPGNSDYPHYGARGIDVCERWHNRDAFMFDMARTYRHGLWLDRELNDCGYEPSNCRWATPTTQAANRTNTLMVDTGIADYLIPLPKWARQCNVQYAVAYRHYTRLALQGPVRETDLAAACQSRI